MKRMIFKIFGTIVVLTALVANIAFAGAGSGETITFSGTYAQQTGTVQITQTPEDLTGAGWSLTGPRDETGSGSATLPDMPVGQYTVTWTAVEGWQTPGSERAVLDF